MSAESLPSLPNASDRLSVIPAPCEGVSPGPWLGESALSTLFQASVRCLLGIYASMLITDFTEQSLTDRITIEAPWQRSGMAFGDEVLSANEGACARPADAATK